MAAGIKSIPPAVPHNSSCHNQNRPLRTTLNRVVNGELPTLVKKKTNNRRHAKQCDIKVGDCILIKQDKQNKLTPRFNEKLLIVVHRSKSRISAEDSDKSEITRNVSHFKRIPKSSNLYNASKADSERETDQCMKSDAKTDKQS